MTSTVAANIRFWREERRWTTQRLADSVGLSRSSISQMESGTQSVTPDHLAAIAQALAVPVARFFEPPPARHAGELEVE